MYRSSQPPGHGPEKEEIDDDEESEVQTRDADDPIEAHLLPGDAEKSHFFKILGELRADFSFCDVSFRCQGQLFRAHRGIQEGLIASGIVLALTC